MKIAREIWEQKPSELYPRITSPVLMVPAIKHSDDPQRDLWTRAKLEGIETAKELLPDVRVLPMENTIHDVPVQRPTELAAAIIEFGEGLR
jgi:hypothetical protein